MLNKLFILLFVISLSSIGCQQNSNAGEINGGEKAPEFSLKSTDGQTITLSDYKGKVVLIDFWATWCGPCRKGIPDLVALQNEYPKDLVVIGISLDRETKDNVVPFADYYKINYPIVYGDEKVVNGFGGVNAIPTSFIIDKKGNIVNKHIGLVPKSLLADEITKLIN